MIGGIIGDLAVSTYLRDKDTFYRQLIDDRATLSEYGLSLLASAKFMYDNPVIPANSQDYERVQQSFRKYFVDANNIIVELSSEARQWSADFGFRNSCCSGMLLVRLAVAGWFEDNEDQQLGWQLAFDRSLDKEEGYARIIVPHLIRLLRSGYTKDETYAMINPVFKTIRHGWQWRTGTTTLCLLMRAWDCFYRSFDFGSAIHNAVRNYPENPRLMATIVGMMASAMYGCGYYFKKRKYNPDWKNIFLTQLIPTQIKETYRTEFMAIEVQTQWQHMFFKKNEALTNVERHHFTCVTSEYEVQAITAETRRRILRSCYTDWENRYGFYLDNGWIYVYRSHYLLGRFQIKPTDGDSYRIVNVMQSDELPSMLTIDLCIRCALNSANFISSSYFRFLKFCRCKPADEANPYIGEDAVKAKFWAGEQMFAVEAMAQWEEWIAQSREAYNSTKDIEWINHARQLGPERFAILYYINALHTKMCPMDDLSWLLKY